MKVIIPFFLRQVVSEKVENLEETPPPLIYQLPRTVKTNDLAERAYAKPTIKSYG